MPNMHTIKSQHNYRYKTKKVRLTLKLISQICLVIHYFNFISKYFINLMPSLLKFMYLLIRALTYIYEGYAMNQYDDDLISLNSHDTRQNVNLQFRFKFYTSGLSRVSRHKKGVSHISYLWIIGLQIYFVTSMLIERKLCQRGKFIIFLLY